MSDSAYQFAVGLDRLVVHRTRGKGPDNDWLYLTVDLVDLSPGIATPEQREVRQWNAGAQVAAAASSGDTVILARRSGESVTTPFISDPIRVGPQQQLTLTYWTINQSHENHDPKAQQERFDKTIQAFRDGVSIAGLITSALLTPAGLVPGAIAAAVTGAVTTALTVTQVLFDALSGGPDVNCDGFVFIGAWSATLDDLVARTATPDAHTNISIRYADLEQSPSACGAAPDTDVVLSLRNLGPVSFDPALTGPRTVRPDVAPVDLSLIGYWGDAPLVDQCRVLCHVTAVADQPVIGGTGPLAGTQATFGGISGAATGGSGFGQDIPGGGISGHAGTHTHKLNPGPATTPVFASAEHLAHYGIDLTERAGTPTGPVIVEQKTPDATMYEVLVSGDDPNLHRHDPNDPPVSRIDLTADIQLDLFGVYLSDGSLESRQLRYRRFDAQRTIVSDVMLQEAVNRPH